MNKSIDLAMTKALRVGEGRYFLPTATRPNGTFMVKKTKRNEFVLYEMMFGDRLTHGTADEVIERAYR